MLPLFQTLAHTYKHTHTHNLAYYLKSANGGPKKYSGGGGGSTPLLLKKQTKFWLKAQHAQKTF